MASEKCSVSCCGIHYPLAGQFFTPARSSGLARLLSSGAVFHKRPRSALALVAPGSSNVPEEPAAWQPGKMAGGRKVLPLGSL